VSEKEHPARIAGRYVRAAGLAIQKGLDQHAADSEEKRAAEEQQATAAAAATQPAPGQPAPAAGRGRAAQPPAETFPPKPWLDRILWTGFVLSIIAVCLAALQIQMVTSGSVRVGIRLGLGIVLILMALPLVTNWQHTNQRLVARFFKKFWGLDAATTRSGRAMRGLGKHLLTLVGILWLALGIFELLRAFVNP
jgi:hypothetical protein